MSAPLPGSNTDTISKTDRTVVGTQPDSSTPAGSTPPPGSQGVTGPSSSTNDGVALWDGTSGTLLKDGGVLGTAAFKSVSFFAPAFTGLSVTITTAKLTGGGANGSMTFTNGVLTASTPAT